MAKFTRNDQRAIIAEFLGTAFFVFVGAGSVVTVVGLEGGLSSDGLIAVAIAHGLAYLVAVAWTGNLSGGHINPAVTVAMVVASKFRPVLGAAYIVAQLAGAALGALVLKLTIPDNFEGGLGGHVISPAMSNGEGLLMEIVLTAFLVLVVFNTAVSRKGWGENAPLAIGFSVLAIHLVAIPWTGASVNPARSFGPALVANDWEDLWVYVVGPLAGAIAVAGLWLFWRNFGEEPLDTGKDVA